MEYQATAKYIRISTRKLRLIADAVRSLTVAEAMAQLSHMPKHAAGPMASVIASATANAIQKQAKREMLTLKQIEVMGGPVMKRFHAVSRGQAHPYKKRMSHVRVILTDEPKEVKGVSTKEIHGTKN